MLQKRFKDKTHLEQEYFERVLPWDNIVLTTTFHVLRVKSATTDNAGDSLRRGSLLKLLSVELESLEKCDGRDSSRRERSGELASDQSSLRRN
ncbi:hypothetical protein HPB50_027797 [Hyalomma asiaticum]|nr:hypothetical protein HPB50_027797 [Hyalomma asiaticum]